MSENIDKSVEHEFMNELRAHGLPLTKAQSQRFDLDAVQAYYNILQRTHNEIRLFSAADGARILERHIYESMIAALLIADMLPVSRETRIADAGSGAGLPGVLLACLKETPRTSLIDSSSRKLGTIEKSLRESTADFAHVDCRFGRLEEMKGKFDAIVIRALAPYPVVVELVCNLQSKGGLLFFMGTDRAEISTSGVPNEAKAVAYLRRLGYVSRETIFPSELKFLGRRSIKILLKTAPPDKGYPRSWKRIKADIGKWGK